MVFWKLMALPLSILESRGKRRRRDSLCYVPAQQNPINQVSFHVDNLRPRPVRSRRSGRPNFDWIMESYRDTFEIMNGPGVIFDASNIEYL